MAYAEASDIEIRLKPKLGRAFTDDESAAAELLCEAASAVIDNATGKAEVDPAPAVLRFVAIEVVCRAMANPQGLASEQEGLGAYSYAQRYVNDGGLWLKELEEKMVRQAVHGKLSGSSELASLASDGVALGAVAPASYPYAEDIEGS